MRVGRLVIMRFALGMIFLIVVILALRVLLMIMIIFAFGVLLTPMLAIGVLAMVMAFPLPHRERLHVVARHHNLALEARCFLEPIDPALEAEAVDEENPSCGKRSWRRLASG